MSKSVYTPYWVVGDERDRELLEAAAGLAGVELTESRDAEDGRAREVRASEHSSVLGRALVAMGAPRGDKNERSRIRLPDYLDDAPQRIAQEFIQVYIHNRGQLRSNTDMIGFREERDESYLRSLARLIRRLTVADVSISDRNIYISAAAAREIAKWEPLFGLETTTD